ncbi:MAG: Vitamin B12 dependent methionine synthase activation subunit, partial [Lachnospiraceae bacterium]|nr:Vitamin B12 dependent methionine synthase activation subunit [Lachnospiraceae bacterium]
ICSRALSQNLSGCGRVIVMAATLGPSLDRAIQRYQYSDTAYAVILHAAGAAAIETYLDDVSAGIISGLDEQEIRLRPRFSPGYGDLDISVNDDIIKDLDASKHAGIFATDTHLLSPSISVTAFAGIFKEEEL